MSVDLSSKVTRTIADVKDKVFHLTVSASKGHLPMPEGNSLEYFISVNVFSLYKPSIDAEVMWHGTQRTTVVHHI